MAKILLIEDEIALSEAYTFLLKHKGHNVSVAYNGEEGLLEVKKSAPDLIILDMMMPILNGIGFLRRYEPNKRPNVKILFLSNMVSPEYEAEAIALGVNRYEIKASLTPDGLLDVVQELLGINKIRRPPNGTLL